MTFFISFTEQMRCEWVLSEWMKISYNAHSGRLGFYLKSENKYIFPLGYFLMLIFPTTYDFFFLLF